MANTYEFRPISMTQIDIPLPDIFSYSECLKQLARSNKERCFQIENDSVYRLFWLEQQPLLIRSALGKGVLEITCLNNHPTPSQWAEIKQFVTDWFDLNRDLKPFYQMAQNDPILYKLVKDYHGLRLIRIPNLFEALSWAIIGQQINLNFAYQVKEQFVLRYGHHFPYNGKEYFHFPFPHEVAELSVDALKEIKFSKQKATYLTGIAKAIREKQMVSQQLKRIPRIEQVEDKLLEFKGIGRWTAQYVLMKTFGFSNALPLQDAGLKNAVRKAYNLEKAPDLNFIKQTFQPWKGWEAYATFYLWRTLMK